MRRVPLMVWLGLPGTVLCVAAALLAPWLSPHPAFEPVSIVPAGMSEEDAMLMQDLGGLDWANKPPGWLEGGQAAIPLGTDHQGRDILSLTLHGLRISLWIGFLAVLVQAALGVAIGLVAGWRGGWLDSLLMRLGDIQLSFSTLMVAIIALAVFKSWFGEADFRAMVPWMLVLVIGLAEWPQYARTVRASVMAEKPKEYVQAARALGRGGRFILLRHVLPNIAAPLYVIAAVQVANAVMAEAALSFLGLGMPPDEPSLGAMVNAGRAYLHSAWWICLVPGLALTGLLVSINLLGDGLRDWMDPRRDQR